MFSIIKVPSITECEHCNFGTDIKKNVTLYEQFCYFMLKYLFRQNTTTFVKEINYDKITILQYQKFVF